MRVATQDEIADLPGLLPYVSFGHLSEFVTLVGSAIDQHGPQGDPDPLTGQALNVAEEAGEFIAEYRRYRGYARRPGDREAMLSELADVIISSLIMFARLGADADAEIRRKLEKVVTRGWNHHEPNPEG